MNIYGKLLAFLTGGQSDFSWKLSTTWHGVDVGLALELTILVSCLAAGFLLCETFLTSRRRRGIAAFFGVLLFATAAYAASSTLGNLSAGSAISTGDLFYDVQSVGSGGTKVTAAQMDTFFTGSPTAPASNITMSTSWAAAQSWFNINGSSLSGTTGSGPADGIQAPIHFYVGGDTVDTTTSGAGFIPYLSVNAGVSAGSTGGRIGVAGQVNVIGTPTLISSAGYVGINGEARCNANLTGSTGVYTNYKGACFGGGSFGWLQGSATFVNEVDSWEFDTSVLTGASVAEKHSITLVKTGSDAVQGTYDDSAIQFADQDTTSVGWNFGVSFGAYAHKWPFTSASTLIGVQNRVSPSPASSPANIGVDMTNGTFTTAQYKGTGYLVDPNGAINVTSLSGLSLAANTLYLAGPISIPTLGANGEAVVYTSTVEGLSLQGQGSTNNLSILTPGGTLACAIANAANASMNCQQFIGQLNGGGLAQTIIAKNTNAGTAAQTEISLTAGTSTANLLLNGSGFSGGLGASAFAISAPSGMWLQGGGTSGYEIDSSGVNHFLTSLIEPVRSCATSTCTASATTDYFLCLDPTSNTINVALPATPATGLTYLIKDCTGKAATHTITVTPNAGNIDGSGTTTLTTNFQSIAITYTGSQWSIN